MKRIYSCLFGTFMLFSASEVLAQVPLTGEGTETSPYVITTAADWNALAQYIVSEKTTFEGQYLKLSADIDFADVAVSSLWANNITYLQGYFDGAGHKLSGINLQPTGSFQGLFGTLGANGTIANLTVAGVSDGKSVTTGGIVGRTYGTIKNCVNEMAVKTTMPAVGGVAGRAFKGAKFIDCVNKGAISGTTNVGGIVGTTEADVRFERCGNEGVLSLTGNAIGGIAGAPCPSTFIDCWNKADIALTGAAAMYAGGIIGNGMGDVTYTTYTITGCRNSGNIIGPRYVAGIMGTVGAANAVLNMTDCHNTGNITSTATTGNNGACGIASAYVPLSTFTNCTNSGKITADKAGYNAGIAGCALGAYSAQKTAVFTGCYNTGEVVSNATCTAGVIGYVNGYTTVTDCYNTGNVTCSSLSGGVVGNFEGLNNTMTACWNIGDVTTGLNRVGGLFGSNTKNNVKVYSSWNAGNVKSTSTVAGMADATGAYAIGGLAGIAAAKFYDCFNLGSVQGMTQVGGILGRPSLNMTGLFNCFNAGCVNGPAEQTGNLIGVNTSDKQQWATANKADNCYYSTSMGSVCTLDASIGTAVTIGELCKVNMGEGWTSVGEYMLPLPQQFAANKAALLYAAMVVPEGNENLTSIVSPFRVGNPEGIKWMSDVPEVTVNGNSGSFSASFTGPVVLTATLGEYMKTIKININGTTTGIDAIDATASELKSEAWFDINGRALNASAVQPGHVYIVVRTYTDNTTRVVKICK